MLLNAPLIDSKSETEMSQNSVSLNHLTSSKKKSGSASRYSVDYWRERLFRRTYDYGSERREIAEWYVQVQHAGRREKVGLSTNKKEEAARRAVKFYQRLRATDWETALREFCPRVEAIRAMSSLTLGDYLSHVQTHLRVSPRTADIYAYALRKVAREATGIVDKSKSRFHPKSHEWRRVSDEIPLAKLTPSAVNDWKDKLIQAAGVRAKERERAGRTINSFVRNARALFSKDIVARLKEKGVKLPNLLPFEGIKLEEEGSTKYHSTFDVKELFRKAKADLQESDPDAWKVIVLALGAGLRRREIDMLREEQINFKEALVSVCDHDTFEAKTEESEGDIFVDEWLIAELKNLSTGKKSNYVVAPTLKPSNTKAVQYYRCKQVFLKVTEWLRKNGVTSDRPLHCLRKEFGSIIYDKADIYAASRQLRHANLSTTAAYYVENRKRVSVPLQAMLTDEPTPPSPKPTENKPASSSAPAATAPVSGL